MPEAKWFMDLNFFVIASHIDGAGQGYVVEFKVYEADFCHETKRPLFHRKGSTVGHDFVDDIADSEVYLSGSVKWDGCSNWNFDEQDRGVMLHGCSREDVVRFGEVMARCWDWTAELIPATWNN